jgi:polyphenol oxidase
VIAGEQAFAAAVQAADCVPLLVADRRTGAVAAAHAGWRGLALRVPETTIEALLREFGSRPADLIAAAGPSIGACCYQVGTDVREQFERAGFSPTAIERWFSSSPAPTIRNPSTAPMRHARDAEHWFFDGWAAVREQLEAGGVPPEQIFVAELCTASHPERFCSYRREGSGTGRLAAVIVAAPPGP